MDNYFMQNGLIIIVMVEKTLYCLHEISIMHNAKQESSL